MNIIYRYLSVVFVASLAAVSAQQDQVCLDMCSRMTTSCHGRCGAVSFYNRRSCRSRCTTADAVCRNNCPTAAAETTNTPGGAEIGRGVCGSQQYYTYTISCAIPSATPDMRLLISVVRQISSIRCISGQNFGLAADNSYMWVSNGCTAEFSISSVATSTPQTATTSATRPAATTTPRPTETTTTSRPTSTPQTATTSATRPAATTTPRPTETTTTSRPTTTTQASSGRNNSNICGQVGGDGFRIIGGTEANKCEFPWMVMIYNQLTQSVCGGTIIDRTHILTAAHCFFSKDAMTRASRKARANELIVFTGSSAMPFNNADAEGLMRRPVTEVITHESYNDSSLVNDVAILKLTSPITFDACHKPLCMVDGRKTPQQTTDCRTMGWGLASNGPGADIQSQLQYVDVPVTSDDACRNVYGSLSTEKTFCAGSNGKDACQGDSGGPFACKEADNRYYVYGVVSAGIDQNCGGSLGLYTKVSSFLPWINSKTI